MTSVLGEETPFELPQRYRDLQRRAADLAQSLADVAAKADEAERLDPTVRERLRASGLVEITVPGEFGGLFAAVDSLAVTVVREQLAYESAHLDSLFAMQGIGSFALREAAPEVQKRWLPAVCSLEAIAGLALTEPHVGSDLRSITTRITADGDDLIVDGRKSFITNAGDADFYTVLAKDGDGMSAVLVPAATPGVAVDHPHQITAPHVLGDVVFDRVRVPRNHLVGVPGQALRLILATLGTFRVSVAGAACGLAQAALDEAVTHTRAREQFGVPLARLGPMPSYLGMNWVEIEMARSLAYRAAAAATRDPMAALPLSSMAKVGATEAADRVVDRCVQMMGRFGIIRGSKVERIFREVRPMRIYEGATEVVLDSLAKQLVK